MKKILKSSIQYIGLISSKPIPENQIFEIPPGPSLNWLTPMLLLVLCPLESFVNFESCQRCRNRVCVEKNYVRNYEQWAKHFRFVTISFRFGAKC